MQTRKQVVQEEIKVDDYQLVVKTKGICGT